MTVATVRTHHVNKHCSTVCYVAVYGMVVTSHYYTAASPGLVPCSEKEKTIPMHHIVTIAAFELRDRFKVDDSFILAPTSKKSTPTAFADSVTKKNIP